MRQYNIKFKNIRGHLEISPFIKRNDPGIKYLNRTRIKLLKELIRLELYHLIGPDKSWNFYKLKSTKKNKVYQKLTQSRRTIWRKLTKGEKKFIKN
jgi:hypothetical protein